MATSSSSSSSLSAFSSLSAAAMGIPVPRGTSYKAADMAAKCAL